MTAQLKHFFLKILLQNGWILNTYYIITNITQARPCHHDTHQSYNERCV